MKITWHGTASVLIESGDTALMFDPFMKDLPDGGEPPEKTERRKSAFLAQKNILITHGHLDHLASVTSLYKDLPCTVYLTKTPYYVLCGEGFPSEKLRLIKPGDVLEFPGVTVNVLRGRHIKFDMALLLRLIFDKRLITQFSRALRLKRLNKHYIENDETLFFQISAEKKSVQLMGSAELAVGTGYPSCADALILPHQGRSDMDKHNRSIAETLRPKRIFLDHYDDAFPPISSVVPTDNFCAEMSKKIPTEKLIEGEAVYI